MRQSTVLILNTAATYIRMLLTVSMGIIAARLIVKTLGYVDYGLLTALGASGAFLSIFTASLTQSAQRHLAYEIGKNDKDQLTKTFNTTLVIYVMLAVIITLIGISARSLVIQSLTIPQDRMHASIWVYNFTLISMVLNIIITPYRSALNAHQAMIVLAWADVVGRVSELGIIMVIAYLPWDYLIAYSGLSLAVGLVGSFAPVYLCAMRYPECRTFKYMWDRLLAWNIASYATWSIIAHLAVTLRDQGCVMIMNSFYGPIQNAAYALGYRIIGYQNQAGIQILSAITPAMVSAEARGDRARVNQMILIAGKYPVLIILYVWIPIMLEVETLLTLWLDEYPPNTPLFARILTSMTLLHMISSGHGMVMQAKGKIIGITLVTSIPYFIVIAIDLALLQFINMPSWAIPVSMLLTTFFVGLIARPIYVSRYAGINTSLWLRTTVIPVVICAMAGYAATAAIIVSMKSGVTRILLVMLANAIALTPMIWYYAMNHEERSHFKRVANTARARIIH